jgi:hypothetical protein
MGDSYDQKPVPNLRASDVVGMLVVAALGSLALYLLAMLIYHYIVGRVPG